MSNAVITSMHAFCMMSQAPKDHNQQKVGENFDAFKSINTSAFVSRQSTARKPNSKMRSDSKKQVQTAQNIGQNPYFDESAVKSRQKLMDRPQWTTTENVRNLTGNTSITFPRGDSDCFFGC